MMQFISSNMKCLKTKNKRIMSYEPAILIKYKDLEKVVPILEEERWDKDEDIQGVAEYLLDVANGNVMTIDGLQLVLCRPEFSSFNNMVRSRLSELEVKFDIDN